MSRCFPFPPPGYEKKTRTDEADILAKGKQKEKKHKKEKKDKDKKEKKDKERSSDKHKENKDRKEKHKDKKDKDKDKDKNKTLDEKRNEGRHEGYNGEKVNQNKQQAEEIKGSKFVQELGRRIRDAEKGTGVQMLENFTSTDQRKAEGMARLVEKVFDNRSEVNEKNKVGADQKRAEVGMARVVEKDFSNRVEGKEKNNDGIFQQRTEGIARSVENAVNWAEGKEKNKEKKNDDRKADVQRNRDEERSSGNAKFQNFTRMDQQRVEGMGKPMEKDAEKRLEGKEKKKGKEGSDKQGDKHKGRDREKKSKGKDKDRSKEKKEREKEKAKEKSDKKNREQDKLKDSSKDPTSTINIKPSALNFSKESDKSLDADGNLRKRKDREMNGFLHGSDIQPNKLPRPAFSSHRLTENGKKVYPCQPDIQFTSDRQGLPNNFKAENKEHKINGIIEVPPASVCSTKEIPATQANENGEASTKPLHPDLKYLSQILSVPKMEEWSVFDDQEWLFSSDCLQSKKPKVGSSVVDETPQVWAEALQIESADVCALPYVIPY
ncbi:glutamic acid-rich protein-like isoform X2 [Telopea speciosissima]|uniref:glutamic acid-rich protein-like isoform X1 n=1 Tax=Telopea speciosissima TaxID=54955 RepID=UPI001CC36EC3|nr:glutamic acid-rich protein-like isoform X1 [Telopea speciosissima]XP_043709292.1 glutamic acid-rich protein-like isoform X2 [Telopea speciosissima]